jgi:hypothetical protein
MVLILTTEPAGVRLFCDYAHDAFVRNDGIPRRLEPDFIYCKSLLPSWYRTSHICAVGDC